MARKVLTDTDWKQMAPLFPKRGPGKRRRLRLEGILWIHRTGAPWRRDLPRCFGPWRTVQSCFERWSKSGLWEHIWEPLRKVLGEDREALSLASTAIKAHRHSAGARKELGPQAIGASRGGRGTKIHAACDALGYPLAVKLTAANESDIAHAEGLLEGQPAQRVVADRGYDSDALREKISSQGSRAGDPSTQASQGKARL